MSRPCPRTSDVLRTCSTVTSRNTGSCRSRSRAANASRLLSTRVEPSGLLRGMAEPIGEDPMPAGTHHLAAHAACAEVLERIIKGVRRTRSLERAVPAALSFRRSDLAIEPARRDPADSAARTAEAHGNRGCRGAARYRSSLHAATSDAVRRFVSANAGPRAASPVSPSSNFLTGAGRPTASSSASGTHPSSASAA